MKIKFCLLLLILAGKSFGQPILLHNASFEEDKHRSAGTTPIGWQNCGPASETPPDIQPGEFGVDLSAADGRNYVSLVVRDNETTEIIGQKLTQPMKKDSIYLIRLFVARSLSMVSPTKSSRESVNYATPAILKIWGGSRDCDKAQLLAQTVPIVNTEWEKIELMLQPGTEITHIFLEACHKTPTLFAYNGNVLIDNISLTQIP